jgi:hypothetical protein
MESSVTDAVGSLPTEGGLHVGESPLRFVALWHPVEILQHGGQLSGWSENSARSIGLITHWCALVVVDDLVWTEQSHGRDQFLREAVAQ